MLPDPEYKVKIVLLELLVDGSRRSVPVHYPARAQTFISITCDKPRRVLQIWLFDAREGHV